MIDFSFVNRVVFVVGRVTPTGVQPLGTCFLLSTAGYFATAAHVTGQDDQNLVVAFRQMEAISSYQDTTDLSVQFTAARIKAYDPFHDTCVLQTDLPVASTVKIGSVDALRIGDNVAIFGYPHADQGRLVLTYQATEIGAKVLIEAGGIKAHHVVLNIQSRPGQSGSPVFSHSDASLAAVLVGSYAPGGGGGISLGGVDPHTLHQTTHAVSAEYLAKML